MLEVKGNIWDYYDKGHWICITTNCSINSKGENVMGRGIALQAKQRFPELPKLIGHDIVGCDGIFPVLYFHHRIITYPTKHLWSDKTSSINLIKDGAIIIFEFLRYYPEIDKIFVPRPGCGAGKLLWKDVKQVIEPIFDDRFCVISLNGE